MAEGVTANNHRRRIAAAMAGGEALHPAAFMAFGNGGHTPELKAKAVDPEASGLVNELIRKPLSAVSQDDLYSVTGSGRLESQDLINVFVSEAALLDSQGNLLGIRNFRPKIKESDESYLVKIKLRY